MAGRCPPLTYALIVCIAACPLLSCCAAAVPPGPSPQLTAESVEEHVQSKLVGPQTKPYAYDNKAVRTNALLQIQYIHDETRQMTPEDRPAVCTGTFGAAQFVLTSAGCCLSTIPRVSTYGIHITIGASHVESTTLIQKNPVKGTYYEFVGMNTSRIITPPEYWNASGTERPNAEWDICLIKLNQKYHPYGDVGDDRGYPMIVHPQMSITRAAGDLKPFTEVFTLGWGAQNEGNHSIPSSDLKSLNTITMKCPEQFSGEWLWATRDPSEGWNKFIGRNSPKFICIPASPAVGSPCIGDEGGHLKVGVQLYVRGVYAGRYPHVDLIDNINAPCMGDDIVNVYVNIATPKLAGFIRRVVEGV